MKWLTASTCRSASIQLLRLLPLLLGPVIVFGGALLAALYPAARLRWLQPVSAMRAA